MSPKQALGQAADIRTDVWAFGCGLYEMLASQPPFTGETITDVLDVIVRVEPDWNALPAATHPAIVAIAKRCLQKKRRDRFHAIGDVRLDLETPLPLGEAAAFPARRVRVAWIVATLIFATAAGLMVVPTLHHVRETPPEPSPE